MWEQTLSKKIVKGLCERKVIDEFRADAYVYGYELLISSMVVHSMKLIRVVQAWSQTMVAHGHWNPLVAAFIVRIRWSPLIIGELLIVRMMWQLAIMCLISLAQELARLLTDANMLWILIRIPADILRS